MGLGVVSGSVDVREKDGVHDFCILDILLRSKVLGLRVRLGGVMQPLSGFNLHEG